MEQPAELEKPTYTIAFAASQVSSPAGVKTGLGILIKGPRRPKGMKGPVVDQISETHEGLDERDLQQWAVDRTLQLALSRGLVRVYLEPPPGCSKSMRKLIEQQHASAFEALSVRGPRPNGLARSLARQAAGVVPREKKRHEDSESMADLLVELEIARLTELAAETQRGAHELAPNERAADDLEAPKTPRRQLRAVDVRRPYGVDDFEIPEYPGRDHDELLCVEPLGSYDDTFEPTPPPAS